MKVRWLIWVPLAAFAVVFAVVALGLIKPNDRVIHSGMVGKPLPAIDLPALVPGKPGVNAGRLASGKPHLINVFASWCAPCEAEAPQLMQLKQAGVEIIGIATADTTDAMQGFLAKNGDPFVAIGDDRRRATQLALGSSGVPESFLVDSNGKIVKQHIGYIGPQDMADILAALEKAR